MDTNGPVRPEQYAQIVRTMSAEAPLPSIEEQLAHIAIKKLYREVGNSDSHRINAIRITKGKGPDGSPVMNAFGSMRVFFVGHSTLEDIQG